jgi:GntR family transcriptional regulator, rspAB operon transcriptional repressor
MKRSLSQQVYDELLERILQNHWVPGELINRREIAAELGVSVAPTLEAMLKLEAEGLLESIPRKGTRIRVITEDDLRGQVILRQALECQAARLYCGERIVQHEMELLKLAALIDNAPANTRQCWEKEVDFHRYLLELTECKTLVQKFKEVMQLNLFIAANRLSSINFNYKYDHIVYRHTELVKKLETKDPDIAERAIREHLFSGLLENYN